MTIAVDLALLLGFLGMLGAALVPRAWVAAALAAPRSRGSAWCLVLFTVLTAGLLANYFLLLVLGRLSWVAATGVALGFASLAFRRLGAHGRGKAGAGPASPRPDAISAKGGDTPRSPRLNGVAAPWPEAVGWLAAAMLWGALIIWTLALPITEWDPKSIWFFHAKIIYFAGGLFRDSGWTMPLLSFSQPDYPKLLPGLAAQAAWVLSYWNEYVPKLSLVVLQAVALIGLLAAATTRFVALLLMAGIVVFNAPSFTPGYADIFLAVHACCATVMLTGAVSDRRDELLLPGLLSCAMLPALKNEGILLALIILAAVGCVALQRRKRGGWSAMAPRAAAIAAIAFLPAVIWVVLRGSWDIHGQAAFGADFWTRVQDRPAAEIAAILAEVAKQGKMVSSTVIIALAALYLRRRLPAATLVCLAVGALYFSGLVLVYIGTPNPLVWHLSTSASRTALSIHAVLYAGLAIALDAVLRALSMERGEPGNASRVLTVNRP